MTRATTPTLKFNIPFSTESIEALRLTFKQGDLIKTFTQDDCTFEPTAVVLSLDERQTADFAKSSARVQMRVKLKNGKVIASNILNFDVREVLESEAFNG